MAQRVMKIVTSNVRPPIPDFRWDWCAYRDGDEDPWMQGWGSTEKEAIDDLLRLEQEEDEAVMRDGV